MTDDPTFLAVENVLTMHGRMVQEFGGGSGVRDLGLLESAVMMPAARFERRFLHDGIAAMAAAYLFHLCKNNPFVDGNKRTALSAAEVFILLNGHRLTATNKQLEELTLDVAEGSLSKDQVEIFFRQEHPLVPLVVCPFVLGPSIRSS